MFFFLFLLSNIPATNITGTIAIQVKNYNDHCPKLTRDTICTTNSAFIINAEDKDAFPNSASFEFTIIPEGTEGKWQVEHFNGMKDILFKCCSYIVYIVLLG